jgi:hypothetical protein
MRSEPLVLGIQAAETGVEVEVPAGGVVEIRGGRPIV